jgi:hypothetical protein
MAPQLKLSASDFQEQPNGDPRGRIWLPRTPIQSEIGSFSVEIIAMPDEELISTTNQILNLLAKDHQTILNSVYGLYQLAAADVQWMKSHAIPPDLSRCEVMDYIRDHYVSVRRTPDGQAKGSISMRVQWDDEHLILFGVRNARLLLESP